MTIETNATSETNLSSSEWWDARYMALEGSAVSKEAKAFAQDVARRVHQQLPDTKRSLPGRQFVKATGAFLADLFRAASKRPERPSYRSMNSNSFTGTGYSYDLIGGKLANGLYALGLIDRWRGNDGGGGEFIASAMRFRATTKLHEIAADHGVSAGTWEKHFNLPVQQPTVITEPLILRAYTTRSGRYKEEGRALPIDFANDSVACELRDRMARINNFMVGHRIEPLGHRAFRRAFAQGHTRGYAWNKGGRIASIGEENYQSGKKLARAAMTIDGEPVIEIDITASHLTILHGLRSQPFDTGTDPYIIPGIDRAVVKLWVTMTLGHSAFHRGWTKEKRNKLRPVIGGDLSRLYPIRKTREAILSHLPILSDWPDIDIGWADLQYLESEVMMETMEALSLEHGVVCLPVHDSIIIPVSKADLSRDLLKDTFKRIVGVYPQLK